AQPAKDSRPLLPPKKTQLNVLVFARTNKILAWPTAVDQSAVRTPQFVRPRALPDDFRPARPPPPCEPLPGPFAFENMTSPSPEGRPGCRRSQTAACGH